MSKILLYHGVTDWKKEPRDGTFLNYNGKHIDLLNKISLYKIIKTV